MQDEILIFSDLVILITSINVLSEEVTVKVLSNLVNDVVFTLDSTIKKKRKQMQVHRNLEAHLVDVN